MADLCAHGRVADEYCEACDAAKWATEQRRRRWGILAEDGAIFGLTAGETAELAALEREFGASGLGVEFRHG